MGINRSPSTSPVTISGKSITCRVFSVSPENLIQQPVEEWNGVMPLEGPNP